MNDETFIPKPKKPKPIRESKIEGALRDRVKSLGGLAVKFNSMSLSGVPDRIILMPGGVIRFVELKSPGKKPTELQSRVHGIFRALGFSVEVIDSLEAAKGWKP